MRRDCLSNAIAAVALVLTLSAPAVAVEKLPDAPPLTILAWGGPPQDQTTPERYKELADAGFTHNYSGFGNADAMAKALEVARGAGVKLMISIPELAGDPEGTARRFKDHPAVGGYSLRDEPAAVHFDELAKWVKRIQSVDPSPDHPCYINLYPNYCPPSGLGTATYREYVDKFVAEVPVPLISFDHYPVVGDKLRPEWYENLEVISAKSREPGKPFWAFALAVAHGPYPVATLPHLRVQAYSNLAYGAQGIQYFTYWTSPSDTWNFHEGPIGLDGRRTAVYERVKEVNQELQAQRGVFAGSKVLSVGHTGKDLPAGTRRFEAASPVRVVETDGTGAVASILSKSDWRFLVVVNRDINKPMALRLGIDPAVQPSLVDKNGSLHPIPDGRHRADVPPGDAAIVAWRQAVR
jgi:hypothetical protein